MSPEKDDQASPRPLATYRVQFNHQFTFRDAAALVPYLAELGISHLYASPYLRARPGSLHGYDVVDHAALNPEVGSPEDFAGLSRVLLEHGMGQLLDIVPNHMGISGGANPWWNGVLENGPSSRYADYFDIDWDPAQPGLNDRVLLPILGDQYGRALERGELKLGFEQGSFRLDYYETRLPIAPESARPLLEEALLHMPPGSDPDGRLELESISTALAHLPDRSVADEQSQAERRRERVVTRRRLRELYESSAAVRAAIEAAIQVYNGTPGRPSSYDALEALLDDQAYRLAYWRVAAEEINYRRFFDINDLAGLAVERPEVFDAVHELILRIVAEGPEAGLRVDHPDGLYDPAGYLRRLAREASKRNADVRPYLVVEKILTGDETLPPDWPVDGTVGYEALNRITRLFVAGGNETEMSAIYHGFVGGSPHYAQLVYEKKKLVLDAALASELSVLSHLLNRLAEQKRISRDFTLGALSDAVREMIAFFPVYRTYIDAESGSVSARDAEYVRRATQLAKRRNPIMSGSVFDFVQGLLLLQWPAELSDEEREQHARFVMKFQQLTGPVMAKGAEDTVFYIYNRLVSLNEVGGEPAAFGLEPAGFHRETLERAIHWPGAMNTTSTHDTKRSEDVRARISVLSELPDLWAERVYRWARLNARHRSAGLSQPAPDSNDEYLLYQTLLGAWPIENAAAAPSAGFIARIQMYMEKATREAKVHTSWISPNEEYEEGVKSFIERLLTEDDDSIFLAELREFEPVIARCGMINSVSQALLKLTLPGVPDTYQGQELWDQSLVDPDNRRPVNFARRRELLAALKAEIRDGDPGTLPGQLLRHWRDGRIKLFVTHLALQARHEHAGVFTQGAYVPLDATGSQAQHLVAFARRYGGEQIIVAVPRLVATLTRDRGFAPPAGADTWGDTAVAGDGVKGRYRNVFTGETVRAQNGAIAAAELFGSFPAALLIRQG